MGGEGGGGTDAGWERSGCPALEAREHHGETVSGSEKLEGFESYMVISVRNRLVNFCQKSVEAVLLSLFRSLSVLFLSRLRIRGYTCSCSRSFCRTRLRREL